jgi:hypothetical protein
VLEVIKPHFKNIIIKLNMKNIYIVFFLFMLKTQISSQVTIASTDAACTNLLFLGDYPNVSGSNWEKSSFNLGTTNTITIAPTGAGGTWTITRTLSRVDVPDVVTVWYTNPSTSALPPTSGWVPTVNAPCPSGTFSVTLATLPLEFLSFEVQNTEDGIQLTWQTASEENTHFFDIERSTNGVTFQSIGTVKTVGNLKTTQSYYFKDQTALTAAYYRLKINDLDGHFTMSKIIFLEKSKPKNIKIYLNIEGAIVIDTQDNIQFVTVINLLGQILKTTTEQRLLIADLPATIYVISVKTDKGYLSEKVTNF